MGKLAKTLKKKAYIHAVDTVSTDTDLDEHIAISVLRAFTNSPAVNASPALIAAISAAHRHAAEPGGLSARVSAALALQQWADAQCVLAEMRIRGIQPRLGALQRWVRECDCASLQQDKGTLAAGRRSGDSKDKGSNSKADIVDTLDAILRTCQKSSSDSGLKRNQAWRPVTDEYVQQDVLPLWAMSRTDCGAHDGLVPGRLLQLQSAPQTLQLQQKQSQSESHLQSEPKSHLQSQPQPQQQSSALQSQLNSETDMKSQQQSQSSSQPQSQHKSESESESSHQKTAAHLRSQFTIVSNISGDDRQPPNDYPAIIFAASPTALSDAVPPTRAVSKIPVPSVPGAFLLTDVLSPSECQQILTAAQVCGFTPDAPKGSSGASILAHNFILLSDPDWLQSIFNRMLRHLPSTYSGGKITGINRRMRVYRYLPNQVYRPHIDGAWPPSGLDPSGQTYIYDTSPSDAPEWSRFTLLFYLNQDFDGGETTFFTPSETGTGLESHPVKPMQGAVLVFPHGCSEGSLLHEGSAVMPGGAKFVIRTDLLYEVEKGFGEHGGGKKRSRDQANI